MNEQRKLVRKFRQILLWPLQLMPLREGVQIQRHWEYLAHAGKDNPWREVADEFTGDPTEFKERHYVEFVTFLPYVQRFLYGEGVGVSTKAGYGESPIHVFRRSDVAGVRVIYGDNDEPVDFHIAHVDLYFLYDLDIAIPVVEIFAQDLSLERAQDTLFRFGRAYPSYWEQNGQGGHCLKRVEWLSPGGKVLAVSDYEKREKYLSFACRHRSPCISSHWEFLLKPMVLHHSGEQGLIRYRQLEYYRMPVMNYLAMEDPRELSRGDYVRLALVTEPGDSLTLPHFLEAPAGFRIPLLLRPLLGGGKPGLNEYPAHVLRTCLHCRWQRRRPVLRWPGNWGARPVPPPVFSAVSDRALPEGGSAHAIGSAGSGSEPT